MNDPCPEFRPDHNGECLNCDEPIDAHAPEAIAAGFQRAVDAVSPPPAEGEVQRKGGEEDPQRDPQPEPRPKPRGRA